MTFLLDLLDTMEDQAPPGSDWIVGGGELGERIRRFDWARTPLGPRHEWPQALRAAVGLVLSSPAPMCVWWGPALLGLYNDACAKLLGERHPGALGRPAAETWREDWERLGPRIHPMLHGPSAPGAAFGFGLRVESGHLSFACSPIGGGPAAQAAGVVCLLAAERPPDGADATPREQQLRRALEQSEQLRAAAEAANKTKDEFLATVSHELRAPLNAISGWAGLLRVGRLDPAAITKAAETIEKNVRAQAKLIEDLLDVSRIVSGRFRLELRELNPALAVEAAVEAMRPAAAAKAIQVDRAVPLGAARVSGDPQRLQQAVGNLLANAVKFTPPGGRISVTLQSHRGFAEISVSDTGTGIRPEFLPHVFERFRQADGGAQRRNGGLGLGLAIVRHIVELHGGRVEATSDGEGRGATFVIRIPLLTWDVPDDAAPVRNAGDAAFAADRAPLGGLHLLTVDDEPDASDMLKVVLEQYGARVTAVSSAAQALERLRQERFDMIVSDIGMPGMNGYELLERVRTNGAGAVAKDIPAIAVTGYARSEDRERALRAGYQEHIVKPVEPDRLAATIARLTRAGCASS